MNSILTSIKKMIGMAKDYEPFDADLIIHINAAFAALNQLGVGPDTGYRIANADNVWSEFMPEGSTLDLVKDYMALKVRLLFDPPTGSTQSAALKDAVAEFEWRLQLSAESNM